MIAKTFDVIRKKRRMFTTYEINPMPKGTILIPKGLVFEIINTEDFPNEEDLLLPKIRRMNYQQKKSFVYPFA